MKTLKNTLVLIPLLLLAPLPALAQITESPARANSAPGPIDLATEAARFRALSLKNEHGTIPLNGLSDAFDQRQRLVVRPSSDRSELSRGAGTASNKWTELGPSNIGGAIRSIVIHPTNPEKIWVGSVTGGIWATSNATTGALWKPVNDFMPKLVYTSLLINPADANVMYAGTGVCTSNLTRDQITGGGILKSTDGGTTWATLAATSPDTDVSSWLCINKLAMHPTNPNILLAATAGRYGNVSAIWRSSDAGVTWTSVGGGGAQPDTGVILPAIVLPKDIAFDPNDGNKAMAGGNDGDIAYSQDGGVTWTKVSLVSGGQRTMIAYAKATPNLVYASVDRNQGEIYVSANGGVTWKFVANSKHLSQGFNASVIWVDPVDSRHVVVAGMDIHRSTDGAETFKKISTWQASPRSPHADHQVIVNDSGYNGTTNRRIYNTNDGGVYRANDISLANDGADPASNGWTFLNNGLAITQFYGGSGLTGARISGGTQDNGTLAYAGTGTLWNTIWGGDGGYSALDGTDTNFLYGEYVFLDIFRSTDGGATDAFQAPGRGIICKGIAEANVQDCGGSGKANFIAPFILDPNNSSRMLAGAASLWVSSDVKSAAPTWRAIKPPHPEDGNYISAIAVAKGNSDVIWTAHNNGEIFRTSNGTAATPVWTQVSSATTPARFVTRIYIDNDNANRVYATFGGYTAGNLWRTTDNGANWTDISGVLPQAPIRGFARNPTKADWLYVGSEVGLFTSEDGGANWFTTNDGPANVSVEELFWLDNSNLVAVTFGRGMFRTNVDGTTTATAPGAPVIGTATAGNASATVSFTAAAANGSAVTAYTVTANPGALTASGQASPIIVSGLVNGTSYTFTVTATSGAGTSLSSGASNSVSPNAGVALSAPNAPSIGSVAFGDGTGRVTIVAPNSNGGSPITGYTVTSNPAGGVDANAASAQLAHTITGLTNGVAYSFKAVAINAIGTSAPSADSTTGTPARVPGAPTLGAVVLAGSGRASVSFTPPASNGGSAITHYVAIGFANEQEKEATMGGLAGRGAASPILVHGMAYGTPYYFEVRAVNALGESEPSVASVAITNDAPPTVPDEAVAIVATAGNARAAVGFGAPAENGSKITKYTVTSNPGAVAASGTASPIIVTGLANDTAYTFTVVATNAVGDGLASLASNSVTPSATTLVGTAAQVSMGWNLLGNSAAPLDVVGAFGDTTKVQTVWKWLPASSKWAFYAPSLVGQQLIDYVAGKGYEVLTGINSGEGYWVNAKVAFTAQLPTGTPKPTADFQDTAIARGLPAGWNLLAIGDNKTPRAFNSAIGLVPAATGDIPTNVTTLWAWDSTLANWYFYAPSLDKSGGLANYIAAKGYLDFGATRTLDPMTGFWANKP